MGIKYIIPEKPRNKGIPYKHWRATSRSQLLLYNTKHRGNAAVSFLPARPHMDQVRDFGPIYKQ